MRITNIEAKFELLADCTNDMPATVITCATPGVARVIRWSWSSVSWVRWSEAESGNWTLTISRPWSCSGTKPVGAIEKTQ